jgi:hypothetical protein
MGNLPRARCHQLDLANSADRTRFDKIVEEADLLLTSAVRRRWRDWGWLGLNYTRVTRV